MRKIIIIFLTAIAIYSCQSFNIKDDPADIVFHITPEKYITKKGKFINILMNITNNGNQLVELNSRIYFHVEDLSRNIKLPVGETYNYLRTELKESKKWLSVINPFNFISYKDEYNNIKSYPWPYIKEGKYRIFFSIETEGGIVKSNEIEIEVLPLNDEEVVLFQQLVNNVRVQKSAEDLNNLFNKHKDTFYAEESYYLYEGVKVDILSKENHPEREKIIGRLKERLIRFPYCTESIRLLRYLEFDFYDCHQAIEEIVETLKTESPESWLLQIIEYTKELIKEREQ